MILLQKFRSLMVHYDSRQRSSHLANSAGPPETRLVVDQITGTDTRLRLSFEQLFAKNQDCLQVPVSCTNWEDSTRFDQTFSRLFRCTVINKSISSSVSMLVTNSVILKSVFRSFHSSKFIDEIFRTSSHLAERNRALSIVCCCAYA